MKSSSTGQGRAIVIGWHGRKSLHPIASYLDREPPRGGVYLGGDILGGQGPGKGWHLPASCWP